MHNNVSKAALKATRKPAALPIAGAAGPDRSVASSRPGGIQTSSGNIPNIQSDPAEELLGLAWLAHLQNQPAKAMQHLRQALKLNPGLAKAYLCLGDISGQRGNRQGAVAAYRAALELEPDNAQALNNLGVALAGLGLTDEALEIYLRGIQADPCLPELYNNFGLLLREIRPDSKAALHSFAKALELAPDHPQALNNLGNALNELGQRKKARELLVRALKAAPHSAETLNSFGLLELNEGNWRQAGQCFAKALLARPDYAAAVNNLGVVQCLLGEYEQCLSNFQKALDLSPDYCSALNNLGSMLKNYGRFDEAIALYRQSLALKPGNPETHHNLALALLSAGEYAEGFSEYAWRWKTRQLAGSAREFVQPRWQGEAARGKTLFIYPEQGFGDSIQFCRYAQLAAQKGLKVVLEAPPELFRLMGSLEGVDKLVRAGEPLPDFDYQAALLDLPGILGTREQNVPASPSYLMAAPQDVELWKARLDRHPANGPRIGLAWAGGSRKGSPELVAADRRRSLAPEILAPLLEVSGLSFVSLQKGGPEAPMDFSLLRIISQSRDFADTAALILNLDLVISVDTAVAHLAAALGKPVWLLNRFDSCWRWRRGSPSTPWYPSMRLFHQPSLGDWTEVIARLRTELEAFAAGNPGKGSGESGIF